MLDKRKPKVKNIDYKPPTDNPIVANLIPTTEPLNLQRSLNRF